MVATLAVLASRFSWELPGSMASLLGTGVTVVVRRERSEFDLVVSLISLRHWDDVSRLTDDGGWADGDGLAALVLRAAGVREKKPRMLCCLPVEGAWAAFFAVDGVLAGVRAPVADFSPILLSMTCSRNRTRAAAWLDPENGKREKGWAWSCAAAAGPFNADAKETRELGAVASAPPLSFPTLLESPHTARQGGGSPTRFRRGVFVARAWRSLGPRDTPFFETRVNSSSTWPSFHASARRCSPGGKIRRCQLAQLRPSSHGTNLMMVAIAGEG